jgi:hypothetical protein
MSKEQQELLDEAYENYLKNGQQEADRNRESQTFLPMPKQMFTNKCKTDTEFSEKWGLKIEERELSDKERLNTLTQNEQRLIYERVQSFKNVRRKKLKDFLDEQKIPTKLITITYNDKTIESYES